MRKYIKRLKAKVGYMLAEVLMAILVIALTVTGIFATVTMLLTTIKRTNELSETREYAAQVIDSIVAMNELSGRNIVTIVSDLYGDSKLVHTIDWDEFMYQGKYKDETEDTDAEDIENPNDVTDIVSWTEMIPEEVRVKYRTEITYIPYTRVRIKDTFENSNIKTRMRDKCVTLEIKVTKIVDDKNSPFLKILGERTEGSTVYYLTLYSNGRIESFDVTEAEVEVVSW